MNNFDHGNFFIQTWEKYSRSEKLFQIEFEPVQTQIPFNVQTKVQFKIPRTQNRSNPQKNDQICIWTKFGRFLKDSSGFESLEF